jgi:hypothetical protein
MGGHQHNDPPGAQEKGPHGIIFVPNLINLWGTLSNIVFGRY